MKRKLTKQEADLRNDTTICLVFILVVFLAAAIQAIFNSPINQF